MTTIPRRNGIEWEQERRTGMETANESKRIDETGQSGNWNGNDCQNENKVYKKTF